MSLKTKKPVLVSAIFIPVTRTRKEMVETANTGETIKAIETAGASKNGKENKDSKNSRSNLTQVLCIQYLFIFQKKSKLMSALLDSSSEVNVIHPTFAQELELSIRPMDIEA